MLSTLASDVVAAMLTVFLVLTAMFVGLVVLTFVSIRRMSRRVRRVVHRQMVSYGPGPVREVSRLQLRLDRSLRSAHDAVATATATGETYCDLNLLCTRLETVGRELDAQLSSIAASRMSPNVLKAMLPPLRARVDAVEQLAIQTASCAATSMTAGSGSELDSINNDLVDEVHFVHARTEVLQQLRAQ